MARGLTKRGKQIRRFILGNVTDHPADLVKVTCSEFGISRQAALRYVRELTEEGCLLAEGTTRQRKYGLAMLEERNIDFDLEGLEENEAWHSDVRQWLEDLPRNVLNIWHYGFTEMVNNAIDHSSGHQVIVSVSATAVDTRMMILDDGVGIFRKIKEECGLEDESHAVLELAKGKLTTAPEEHTGEGIFFTSRMFDKFVILSGDVHFSHKFGEEEDWIMEAVPPNKGTAVLMGLENDARRTTQGIFDQFASSENDYGFTKTVVPVRMAQRGVEQLVSRSQAKRLLARVERFSTVILDFQDVEFAGRAFLDEIFRVFAKSHRNVLLISTNTSAATRKMIEETQRGW